MITNLFPININLDSYQVTRVKYEENLLTELRTKHNNTHSFFRDGDHIYISNKSGEDLGIGEDVTLSKFGKERVTASLIKHIFFKSFIEDHPEYKPSSFYPFKIRSQKSENDLIRKFLPDGLKGRLSYVKEIEVQLRNCIVDDTERFGFVVNIDRFWQLNISCKELIEKGFELHGLDVVHCEIFPGLESVILPNDTFIGEVVEIDGILVGVKTNSGIETYSAEELYLRKTNRNILNFLTFGLRSAEKAQFILDKLKIEKYASFQPETSIQEIQLASNLLFNDNSGAPIQFSNKDGFTFSVESNVGHKFQSYSINRPVFIFDPAKVRTNSTADFGLRQYGPYDSNLFSPKTPKVLIICGQNSRGRVAACVKELFDGIPHSQYFTRGLKSKYELHDIEYIIEQIGSFEIQEVERVVNKLTEKPDIVMLEIPARLKSVKEVENSFYYLSKSYFLSREIPVQIISSEIMNSYNEMQLNAISLQMYAKLGGIPWTIQTKDSVDKELVIGIGNSVYRNNQYAGNDSERIVAISTFFSADGQYLMSGAIKDVKYESYFEELLASLRESFDTLSKEYGWKPNDTVRLIFHIFKPIKNIEFDVVQNIIKEYSQYRVQFAFVTISEFHPLKMYDESQAGEMKYGKVVGKLVPLRGCNIKLSRYSCLIQMLGPKEMKTSKHGASNPILIRIVEPNFDRLESDLKDYLFTDLHYIVQQIFQFSYLSWRSFLPNQRPATMLYSNLIARLLGKLRRIDGWRPEMVNFNLKFKKWFL